MSRATDRIDHLAREVEGHVTYHANWSESSAHYPAAEWACTLVWSTGDPANPAQSFFGTGPSIDASAVSVVEQIDAAIQALANQEEKP